MGAAFCMLVVLAKLALASDIGSPDTKQPTRTTGQLVAQLDPSRLGMSVTQFVREFQDNPDAWTRVLGDPISVDVLAPLRIPDEDLKYLEPGSPDYRVQNAVLLTYSTSEAANAAAMTLARELGATDLEETTLGRFLSDPLVPIVTDSKRYQWGLYSVNAITSVDPLGVWASNRGSAYVAVLDNGIMTDPQVHEDLAGNFRSQLSYNYASVEI